MKKLQSQLFALLVVTGLTYSSASAEEYKIPATQEEFNTQWEIIPGEVASSTWTWVDGATPYASTASVNEGEKGAILILREPVSMNAGDIYYLQASVSTDHFNNDAWFYIVYGKDKDNLQDMQDDDSAFKCWGKSGGGADFKTKPADSSNLRKLSVTETGDYYIGIRSKKSSPVNKPFYVASLFITKDVNYPQKVSAGKAVADPAGKLETTLTWKWPAKNKDNTEITGNLGANIYRSTSDSKASLYNRDALIATVSGGTPGAEASFVDNATNSSSPIAEAGKYYYYIAPFNDLGENSDYTTSSSIQCKWVGEDTKPLNALNAVAKAEGDNVIITWTSRMEGYNGGYINPEFFSTKITRSKDKGDETVIIENLKDASSYTDENLDGAGSYVYKVIQVYKDEESSAQSTAAIFAGGAFDTPYSENFDTDNSSMFTIFSSTYNKWQYNTSYYPAGNWMRLSGSSYSPPKATMVTPPIRLKAGKTYRIAALSWVDSKITDDGDDGGYGDYGDYAASSSSSSDVRSITISTGQEPSETSLSTLTQTPVNETSDNKVTVEAFFSPTADGTYYFGFTSENKVNSNYIYLDDIIVEETTIAPAPVGNFSATPDPTGADKATVAFTLPSKTKAGTALDNISKAVVTRTATEAENPTPVVAKTLTGADATPGAEISFSDNVPEAGMYSYAVVCFMNSGTEETASDAVESEPAWIGYDVPKAPSAFGFSYSMQEKGDVSITWNALSGSTLGTHGGFVDAANLKYRVYRVGKISETEPVLVSETSATSCTDSQIIHAPWDNYSYKLSAVNGTTEGAAAEGYSKVNTGKVTAWPYTPELTDAFVETLPGRFYTAEEGIAFKNRGAQGTDEYIVYLPPFHANNATELKCNLSLDLSRSNVMYGEVLEVFLCTIERDAPALKGDNDNAIIEATPIPGSGTDNRTSLKTIPVSATPDAPATENVPFTLPGLGKYRLALKCASEDNKGLTIHRLTLDNSLTTGVNEMAADGICIINGKLSLPANTIAVSVYTLDGICVATAGNAALDPSSLPSGLDLSVLTSGLYIIKATTADSQTLTAKIRL